MSIRGEFRVDPVRLQRDGAESELVVAVPYTGPETTLIALERAADLTAGFKARILLVAVHTLPYPVPFVCPALVHANLVEQLLDLACRCKLPVEPQVILARDRMEGFQHAFKPGSTVVVATHRRVWRTPEESLARELAHQGHHVALMHVA